MLPTPPRALPLLAALLLAGCAGTSGSAGLDEAAAEVDGIDTLVLYLQDYGFALEPAGLSGVLVAGATGATYRVSGLANPALLEAYEFETDEAARDGLQQLRAEVRSRVRQEVYARGPLVVYVRPEAYADGENRRLKQALAAALGSPRGGA